MKLIFIFISILWFWKFGDFFFPIKKKNSQIYIKNKENFPKVSQNLCSLAGENLSQINQPQAHMELCFIIIIITFIYCTICFVFFFQHNTKWHHKFTSSPCVFVVPTLLFFLPIFN